MSQDTGDDPLIEIDLCQNCRQALKDEYCYNCGQRNKGFIRHRFVGEHQHFSDFFTTNLISTLISLWIIVYLFLSLKFFFQQGYIITFVKNIVINII